MKPIRGMHLPAIFASFCDCPAVTFPFLLIGLYSLPDHLIDAAAAVPGVPLWSWHGKLIGRLKHPAERTYSHLPMPAGFLSTFSPPVEVLILAVHTFFEVPISS